VNAFESPTESSFARTIYWSLLVAVFPVVGLFTGWTVGKSESPVVNTLLPLVFGLLGALSLGLLDSRVRGARLAELLKSLDSDLRERVLRLLEVPRDTSLRLPAFWALGVLLFCGACYGGIRIGMASKTVAYTPLHEIEAIKQDFTALGPVAKGRTYRLWWYLQSAGLPEDEARVFLATTVMPLAKEESTSSVIGRFGFESPLEELVRSVTGGARTERKGENIAKGPPDPNRGEI